MLLRGAYFVFSIDPATAHRLGEPRIFHVLRRDCFHPVRVLASTSGISLIQHIVRKTEIQRNVRRGQPRGISDVAEFHTAFERRIYPIEHERIAAPCLRALRKDACLTRTRQAEQPFLGNSHGFLSSCESALTSSEREVILTRARRRENKFPKVDSPHQDETTHFCAFSVFGNSAAGRVVTSLNAPGSAKKSPSETF